MPVMDEARDKLTKALWHIYRQPDRPVPWAEGGNLPWNDPDFSERMLREHLDESHGAASRITNERLLQLDWLWSKLGLNKGASVLDVTCGPGLYSVELARRGCRVTGIDFSPASITYARQVAQDRGVDHQCTFIEQDVRQMELQQLHFDAALLIYGQLAVFEVEEAQALLTNIAHALRPGGRLVVELLDQDKVDKSDSTWWFNSDGGLWGDAPFIHMGERFWLEEEAMSIERFITLHLDTGESDKVILCDQTYAASSMVEMMEQAGFAKVDVYVGWDELALYDAIEWVVFIGQVGKKDN